MMKTAEERQIDLEIEQQERGVKRYREELQKAVEGGRETTLLPQRMLLVAAIPKISNALKKMFNAKQTKNVRFRKPQAVKLLETINPDVTAFITTSEVINSLSMGRNHLETEMGIARGINDYITMQEFKKKTPRLYAYAVDKVNHSSNQKYKRNSLRHYAHFSGVDSNTSKKDSVLMGVYLLELFIKETGLVSKVVIKTHGKSKTFLKASPDIVEWLKEKHNQNEVLQPWLLPMVVPPYQWTNGSDGGYRTMTMPFIKGLSAKECNDIHEKHDFSTVYKAVNAVQDTAWKVNSDVLDVLNYYVNEEIKTDSKVLPNRFGEELPQLPCLQEEIDEYKHKYPNEWARWKQRKSKVFTENRRNESKFITVERKVWMANKFRDEEAIYFPHNVDFRGRVYPLVPMMNPQSDDLGKALLEFAYGEEVGDDGEHWFKVHLANTYGIDKESIDNRLKWTDEHKVQIQLVASDPLQYRGFWEKADSPWQFLAACFEYNRYLESGLGAKFVSVLPVGLDGTCSGLQHFSSMLRDEIVGAAVNLVPQDKPADVYQQVANKVEEKLRASDDPLASTWIGKVTRKLVKRQVMTLPYGATLFGMRDQLKKELKDQADAGNDILGGIEPDDEWKLINFLTDIIWGSIKEVLTSTVEIMDWLKSIAKLCAENGKHLEWDTPAGFHVKQFYKKNESKKIDTNFNSIRITRRLNISLDILNKKKQGTGFSPNMVHSMDAAHMMNTVNQLVNMGVNDFSMVHDSFAVHIGHVSTLANELRKTFVEQYKDGFIELFHKQLEKYSGLELPKPPKLGNLDLSQVIHSDYFFN